MKTLKQLSQHFGWVLIMAVLLGTLGTTAKLTKGHGKEIAVVVIGSIFALGAIAAMTAEAPPAAEQPAE